MEWLTLPFTTNSTETLLSTRAELVIPGEYFPFPEIVREEEEAN